MFSRNVANRHRNAGKSGAGKAFSMPVGLNVSEWDML